jgi:hypothetical protein
MKIKFVNEIPQWIISSDIAAYHPATKTIWIRNNLGWKTIPTLIHELTHWFIHKFLGNSEKLHNKLDGKNLKLTITAACMPRWGLFSSNLIKINKYG